MRLGRRSSLRRSSERGRGNAKVGMPHGGGGEVGLARRGSSRNEAGLVLQDGCGPGARFYSVFVRRDARHPRTPAKVNSPESSSMSCSPLVASLSGDPPSFSGEEKRPSMGCMPCSSRTPVSGSSMPVFLQRGQLTAPRERIAFHGSRGDGVATYRPLTPSSWKSPVDVSRRLTLEGRGAIATVESSESSRCKKKNP